MKQKLFFIALFIIGLVNVTAQNTTFRVQGHERPDIQKSNSLQTRGVRAIAGEDKDFTFDDIKFWVGQGKKRAALVIDWYDGKGGTLVWGFRWDGTATGYDMICAVAKADPRFLYLVHDTNIGQTVAGFGYDLNGSGNQYLIFDGEAGSPYYPNDGVVATAAYNYDDWTSGDPEDHWCSGWYNGYWSYQVKDSQEEDFSYSPWGCSSRELTDGCWDGWGYQDGWDNSEGVVPRTPYTSVSPLFPSYNSYWSEMGKDSTHLAVVDKKIARKADELSEKWKIQLNSSWLNGGQPIIVNGNVYIAINNRIMIIDAETGDIIKENTLAGSCGYFSMIAYGEGKIFVPMNNGLLQAFNAETLEPIWITESKSGFQHLCPVVYHDGYVYTGMWKGGASATGTYYCVSAKDEDPRAKDEVKSPVWESDNTGFYWTGGTVVGDYIFFGGDSGYMQSRNRKTGELIDTYQIDTELATSTIRSGSSYDKVTGMLYFAGKETKKIYGVKIKENGAFDKDNVVSNDALGQSTTTPTVYNGRIYTTSGTMVSGGGLDVFDALTMEKIYSVNIGGISQSTPLLTTAYATPENKNTVYVYVCVNNSSGDIVCIKDFEGNKEPIVQFTYTPSSAQYCTHSLVADDKGTVYYKNDSKYLFALESEPTVDVTSVKISSNSVGVYLGQTYPLMAKVYPEDATNKNVTWGSSDTEVVTVDENGLITPVDGGSAIITVTTEDGNFTATCTVKVFIFSEKIELDKTSLVMEVGETAQLQATVSPENATMKTVFWETSDSEVASVDQSTGLITALADGEATITAYNMDGREATCAVTVKTSATSVTLNEITADLSIDETLQLVATVAPENATNKNVTWESSDAEVATVSQSGLVTAIGIGSATITVETEDGDLKATCLVTIASSSIGGEVADLSLYVDSFTGNVVVNTPVKGLVVVSHISGETVLSANVNAGETRIETSNLQPGVYVVRFGDKTLKFIKK
ncbi:uncharacterized protein YjdB [Dysgonomonas sp. PH5-45]|uniref:Ig-like domain-containing protein n=1 Tax=unclassified Dysgonomonas TaxID=2630389 RepID=UPI002476E5C8|nr:MULTISPECIES: Ig-like domain-containing protein [unclassified Dysgonomonas]MDH6354354.1 uncharacterized protein YjdB [Dysgonomonas sp. PH5-45]MDH6387254.1 uncharacterized protein YjdB [Dysgonomonas sp. PH5-37]